MHDHFGIFPLLPSKPLDLDDEFMLEAVRGTVWQTCWEYVLTHTLTPAEGSAFWHGANLVYEAMSSPPVNSDDEAQVILAKTSTDTLLTQAYHLTHKMHAARDRTENTDDLRAQRDLITAEILRRCR